MMDHIVQGSQAEPEEEQAPASAPEKPLGGLSLPSFPAKVRRLVAPCKTPSEYVCGGIPLYT